MYLSFFLLHETKERDQCTTRDIPPCCTEPDDDGDAVLRRGCVYQVITRPCSAGVVAGADQELARSACVQRLVLWTPVCNSVQSTVFSLRASWPCRVSSRYGDNGLQQRSVYVTPGRLEVVRRHRLKLASVHAQRE